MGTRKNKLLLDLKGMPVIARTLLAFEHTPCVDEIVLVCREEDRVEIQEISQIFGIRKLTAVVKGGETRQQSVFSGVQAAGEKTTHFAIHDGARALITPEAIQASVEDGIHFRASSLGIPVKDTIKVIDGEGFVKDTPDRAFLWNVQTPQVFEKNIYHQAMEKAKEEKADYTDDCQLVEQLGMKVHLCMGSYENIKITTMDDLALGEHILLLREEET